MSKQNESEKKKIGDNTLVIKTTVLAVLMYSLYWREKALNGTLCLTLSCMLMRGTCNAASSMHGVLDIKSLFFGELLCQL